MKHRREALMKTRVKCQDGQASSVKHFYALPGRTNEEVPPGNLVSFKKTLVRRPHELTL